MKNRDYANTLEKYHICKTYQQGIHLNDRHTDSFNPIYDIMSLDDKNPT
jgi:hypothetical protein